MEVFSMKYRNLFFYVVILLSVFDLGAKFHSLQTQQEKILQTMAKQEEVLNTTIHDIEALERKIDEYVKLIPFNVDSSKITGIKDNSKLTSDEDWENHFYGEIYLTWDKIPNASGYQIEFNYLPDFEETEDTSFILLGSFNSNNTQISEGLKFRIRAFGLQNGEKIWGEFSDWYSLEVE